MADQRHILFVDDEPNVLEGLRRLLRPMRKQWKLYFALGGQAAQQMLGQQHLDVIVTDVRMPGIDGPELLRFAQEHHPKIIRMVLSGQTEMEAALRTLPVAHQFLSKPCDPQLLKSVVDRACSLNDLLHHEKIQSYVGELQSLPSRPEIYGQLLEALAQPDTTGPALARIIEADLGLCAKVLQLVNSSYFGATKQISGIEHAVTYLGTNMLKDIVLSFEVHRWMSEVECPEGFSPRSLQEIAMLSARLATDLVDDEHQKGEAFTAAMLADVGQIVLATGEAKEFENVLKEHKKSGRSLAELEREAFGVDHMQIGAYLLGLWGLPYAIVEAVAFSERPSQVQTEKLDVLGATHIATALSTDLINKNPNIGTRLDSCYIEGAGLQNRVPSFIDNLIELYTHQSAQLEEQF